VTAEALCTLCSLPSLLQTQQPPCSERDTRLDNATGVQTFAAGHKYLAGCRHLFVLSDLITYLEALF